MDNNEELPKSTKTPAQEYAETWENFVPNRVHKVRKHAPIIRYLAMSNQFIVTQAVWESLGTPESIDIQYNRSEKVLRVIPGNAISLNKRQNGVFRFQNTALAEFLGIHKQSLKNYTWTGKPGYRVVLFDNVPD